MVQYFRQIIKIQHIKYVIAGITGAMVNLGFLYILTEWLNVWYLFSASISLICSLAVSFILHKFWTFGDSNIDVVHRQAISYLGVAVLNLAINTFLMLLLVEYLHVWYLLAQIISAGLIAISSFIIYRLYVFNSGQVV